MATILFQNNASTTLAGAISPTDTALNVAAGTGADFPAPGANEYFVLTLEDALTGLENEILHVTNVTGDTFTIVRAQEGTAAQSWSPGDPAANLLTAGSAAQMLQQGQGQSQSGNYAVDTGTANNYIVALTPALTVHIPGMPIRVKILNTSTGASQLNPGPGNKPIVNVDGSAIAGPELPAGGIVTFIYDGTSYQASATEVQLANDIGSFSGDLKVVNDNSTPNTKTTITATAIVLVNSGGNSFKVRAVNTSIDYTTTGAGGLDTGALAANTWYYEYIIYNSSTLTTAGLASLSATAPTLPSGFTYSKRIGAQRSNGSSHLYQATQTGALKQWKVGTNPATPFIAATGSTGGGYTSGGVFVNISLAAFMPPTAVIILGLLSSTGGNSSGTLVAPSNTWPDGSSYPQGSVSTSGAVGVTETIPFEIVCETPQQIVYMSNVTTNAIAALGYRDTI